MTGLSKLSTLEQRVAQAVKDKCLKFDKEDELDGCVFYKIKFYPHKNSKKHTTLDIKIGRLSPECDCETTTTMTTGMGTPPTTNAEAIDDLKFIVLRDGVISSATTMDKRRIENQLVGRSNDGSIRNIANILVTLGLDTNDPRKNEIAQQLLLSPTALAVATILSNEGLITVTQFNDIINKAPTLFGTPIHALLIDIQFYNFENLFNGDHILTTTPSLYQDVADGAVGIRFSVTHDSIFDFFSQNTGNILPSITAGFDDWIMKHCSEMTVTASTMGGDVSSLKDMATSKTYPESFDYEAVFCMMQKHKPWWNCKGYRYRVDCKTKEHRTVWQRIQNNEMLVLKRTNKTEDGGRLYDLFSTMEPNKRLHRIRIDRKKLHSPALGQKKYVQTNQAIGCMTDAFYNLALQSRGCGKVTIGGKEFMISPKEKLNGKTIDQKTQAKRLVRMAQYLKEEFKKPCLKERATKAARREKLRLKVLSESNDEICYKLWIQDNGKKLHSVYFTLKSTITMSLITNPQNALCKCVIEARNKMNMAIETQKDIVGRLSVNGMQTPISVLLDLLTGDIGASYTTNLPRIRPAMNDVRAAYNKVKDLICTDLPADILACINASS